MPERTARTRVLGALSAGLLAALLAAPAAAQTDTVPPPSSTPEQPDPTEPQEPDEPPPPGSWEASTFDAPFDLPDASIAGETFDVSGTLRYQRTSPADHIREVEVRVVDDPSDSTTPADVCPLPDPVTSIQDGPRTDGFTAEHPFLVEAVRIPCNGRYLVEAEGRLEDPEAPSHTLQQSFLLEVPPVPVTGLGVVVDGQSRSVTVTFQPIDDTELALDAIGYVLERSGSEGADFVDVASIDVEAEPELVDALRDTPAGSYTYRVRAVRAGPRGDVRSSVADTESDTVEVTGDPEPSGKVVTGTSGRRSTGSRSTGRRLPAPIAGRATTPTTIDTGFGDTLDYGEPGAEAAAFGDDPLAGQSIVQDEGEGMGLAVPAAGALVMLGWAGHILYLNRLAKQL